MKTLRLSWVINIVSLLLVLSINPAALAEMQMSQAWESISGKAVIAYIFNSLETPRSGQRWDGRSAMRFRHSGGRSGGITSGTGGHGDLIQKMTGKCEVELKYTSGNSAEVAVYDTGWNTDEQFRFKIDFSEAGKVKYRSGLFLPNSKEAIFGLDDGSTVGEINMESNNTREYSFAAFKRMPKDQWDSTYGFICNF